MDNTDTPDLLANTGSGDSSSPWNGLLFSALQSGVSLGTTAVNNAIQAQTPVPTSNGAPPPAAPAAAAVATSGHHNWMLYAIGAALVLVLGWFLVRKN